MILGLDIETCSAVDIKDGAPAYAAHPSTKVWCAVFVLSSSWKRALNTFRWTPGCELPAWVTDHCKAGRPVLAHYVGFEDAILEHILCPRQGWPKIHPHRWVDSAALAAACALPQALENLGETIGAETLKDAEGKKLMLSLAKAKPGTEPDTWVYPDVTPEQLNRLLDYCEKDVLCSLDCYWKLPKLPAAEANIVVLDRIINHRGVQIDLPFAESMAKLARKRETQLGIELVEMTEDLARLTGVAAMTDWLMEQGVEVPKVVRHRADGTFESTHSLGRGVIADLLKSDDLPPQARRVLEIRAEASRLTSLAKIPRVKRMVSADGRLRGALRYGGAHTLRWSSKGIQLHNLARPSKAFRKVAPAFREAVVAGDIDAATAVWPVLEGLSYSLRSLVVAPPGKDLIGGDFAAIEARVLAWLVGQEDKLEVFRRFDATPPGPARDALDPYLIAAKKQGSEVRDFGKVLELALGYGMGEIRLQETARTMVGLNLSLKECRKAKLGWRALNPLVPIFWQEIEDAFRDAITDPTAEIMVGRVRVTGSASCIRIWLPSGRALHYWRPSTKNVIRKMKTVDAEGEIVESEVQMNEIRFYTAGGDGMELESTYGGKLCENIVQAIARDLLRDALIRLAVTDYRVVLHVHDSICAEVSEGAGSVEDFCGIMAEAPQWAAGLPIAVEGYRSRHFKG